VLIAPALPDSFSNWQLANSNWQSFLQYRRECLLCQEVEKKTNKVKRAFNFVRRAIFIFLTRRVEENYRGTSYPPKDGKNACHTLIA
jgi:hypothetical protein